MLGCTCRHVMQISVRETSVLTSTALSEHCYLRQSFSSEYAILRPRLRVYMNLS